MPERPENEGFGTEPHKLVRRDDPETSRIAAESIDSAKMEKEVYEAIRGFGSAGCISDEVRRLFPGKPYSTITARYKALRDKGLIEVVVDANQKEVRRKGDSSKPQRVMRARVIQSTLPLAGAV